MGTVSDLLMLTQRDEVTPDQRNSKGQYLPGNGPWKSGQSGNPNGRQPNTSSITYWYKRLLAENEGLSAKQIAAMAIKKAEEGSLPHTQEVTDRTDGKVLQPTDQPININPVYNFFVTEPGVMDKLGKIGNRTVKQLSDVNTEALSDTQELLEGE